MRIFVLALCIVLFASCRTTRGAGSFEDAALIEKQRAELQYLKYQLHDIERLADASTLRAEDATGRLDILEAILDECFRRLEAIYRKSYDTRSNERADSDENAGAGRGLSESIQ